jgi:hypothetical protein
MVCELRREHPRWGPRRVAHELARTAPEPTTVVSRSTVYRILVRHRLIEPRSRRRKRTRIKIKPQTGGQLSDADRGQFRGSGPLSVIELAHGAVRCGQDLCAQPDFSPSDGSASAWRSSDQYLGTRLQLAAPAHGRAGRSCCGGT